MLVFEVVFLLMVNGYEVWVEMGVGEFSNFIDYEYSEVGVEICLGLKDIFECDIILKVVFFLEEEVDMFCG